MIQTYRLRTLGFKFQPTKHNTLISSNTTHISTIIGGCKERNHQLKVKWMPWNNKLAARNNAKERSPKTNVMSRSQVISSHYLSNPWWTWRGPSLSQPCIIGLAFQTLVCHNVIINLWYLTTVIAQNPNLIISKESLFFSSPNKSATFFEKPLLTILCWYICGIGVDATWDFKWKYVRIMWMLLIVVTLVGL